MKNIAKLIGMIGLSILFSATFALADITGSAHDFSAQSWSQGEICLPCHTPHHADMSVSKAPLWNHANTQAVYTLYQSPTMHETPVQPLGISKLCLSCHDGTVAVDSFGNHSGSQFIGGTANLGTDLSNDHPISISWTHQTIVPFGMSSQCTYCHTLIHQQQNPEKYPLPFYTYDNGNTYKVECATCHDPHNKDVPGEPRMLRKSNLQSQLCLGCHNR